ncbi:hypothetical protein B0H14DRAFT_2649303 [Mycena olivaceomarginata]|nr:hypothetical protein B0H14DRAFT_2649303 [Mycena olivaceomarginata]
MWTRPSDKSSSIKESSPRSPLPRVASARPPLSAYDNLFNLSWAIQYYLRTAFGHNIVTEAFRALRASIDELETPLDANTFQGFPVSEKWEAFWSLLQERVGLDERVYGTRQGVRHCCVIGEKIRVPALLRLPGIQVKDTIGARGGHRETCSWKPEERKSQSERRAGADSCDGGWRTAGATRTGVEILATEATVADEEAQEQADRVHIKTSSGAGYLGNQMATLEGFLAASNRWRLRDSGQDTQGRAIKSTVLDSPTLSKAYSVSPRIGSRSGY